MFKKDYELLISENIETIDRLHLEYKTLFLIVKNVESRSSKRELFNSIEIIGKHIDKMISQNKKMSNIIKENI